MFVSICNLNNLFQYQGSTIISKFRSRVITSGKKLLPTQSRWSMSDVVPAGVCELAEILNILFCSLFPK